MSEKSEKPGLFGIFDNVDVFKKPFSWLFAVIGILAPVLYLINLIVTKAFPALNKAAREAAKVAKQAAETYQNNLKAYNEAVAAGNAAGQTAPVPPPGPQGFGVTGTYIAVFLVLAGLIALAIVGFFIWKKGRLFKNFGEKFVPNIQSFIKTLGIWFGVFIGLGATFIALVLTIFNSETTNQYVISALGLSSIIQQGTWFLVFNSLLRGFAILVITKIILFLLEKRWVIWQGICSVRKWLAGFGSSAADKGHVAIGFVGILLVLIGLGLIYQGILGRSYALVQRTVGHATFNEVSGGQIPDALTGVAGEIGGKGLSEVFRTPAPQSDAVKAPVDPRQLALYSGLISLFLGLASFGFLVLTQKRRQQSYNQ